MALPNQIDPASPVVTDSPGDAYTEFQNLKQYIIDVFGVPSASNVTAAPFSITAAGLVTLSQIDTTFKNIIVTQGTITAIKPAIDITATWNAVATFTAIKANITDTSSDAGSLLLDLQVGGASKFSVDKDGDIVGTTLTVSGALSAGSISATGTVALTDNMTITDAKNIILNATTGTKIGTATTQKLGFYNATPIVQPSATTDLRTALINLGLYASGGASPLDLNGGALTAGGITMDDAANIVLNATTGSKIGTATTQKIGFWNVTPVVQPAAANQAAITNSTGGSQDGTLAAISGSGDDANINNNFTDLHTLLDEIRTALVNIGAIKGSA